MLTVDLMIILFHRKLDKLHCNGNKNQLKVICYNFFFVKISIFKFSVYECFFFPFWFPCFAKISIFKFPIYECFIFFHYDLLFFKSHNSTFLYLSVFNFSILIYFLLKISIMELFYILVFYYIFFSL